MNQPIISKLTIADKQDAFDLLQNKKVMKFLGPRRALTDQEAQQWFDNELNEQSRFTFKTQDTQELIGFCGITRQQEQDDFGYFLREKFWGKGFATSMCKQSINALKENFDFNHVHIFIADDNLASLHLAKKMNWLTIKKDSNEFEKGTIFQIL